MDQCKTMFTYFDGELMDNEGTISKGYWPLYRFGAHLIDIYGTDTNYGAKAFIK